MEAQETLGLGDVEERPTRSGKVYFLASSEDGRVFASEYRENIEGYKTNPELFVVVTPKREGQWYWINRKDNGNHRVNNNADTPNPGRDDAVLNRLQFIAGQLDELIRLFKR